MAMHSASGVKLGTMRRPRTKCRGHWGAAGGWA